MKFSKLETIVVLFLVVILIVSVILAPKGSYIDIDNTDAGVTEPVETEPPADETVLPETDSEIEQSAEELVVPDDSSLPDEEIIPLEEANPHSQPCIPYEDEWGLTLCIEDAPNGVVYNFVQNGGAPTGELMYGSDYTVEKLVEGEWLPVEYIVEGNVTWTAEAYNIPMNGETEKKTVSFDALYGELSNGIYRFGKSVMDFRQSGDFDNKMYYAEFDIN